MSLNQVHKSLDQLVQKHEKEVEKLYKQIKKLNLINKTLQSKNQHENCLYVLITHEDKYSESDEICVGVFNNSEMALKFSNKILDDTDKTNVKLENTIETYPVYANPKEIVHVIYMHHEESSYFLGIRHREKYYPPEIEFEEDKTEEPFEVNTIDKNWN